jgi:hypothetical protein
MRLAQAAFAVMLIFPWHGAAQTGPDPSEFFRLLAEDLVNDDADSFLDRVDRNSPQFSMLREAIQGLLAAYDVGSTIEIVKNEGDDQARTLELDWLLVLDEKAAINGTHEMRRQIIKCEIRRSGKDWKIWSVEPLKFFQV